MIVEEWMTTNVITTTPESSMMKASSIMKEKGIRRLPVCEENGTLVGIVSDRDIRDASPSKATTLEIHELYYLLSELKVKDIMTKNPVKAKKTDSVESVALLMTKYSFGGVPIVDDSNKICGIITDTDIFKVLTTITGVKYGGIQLALDFPNEPGHLRPMLGDIRDLNARVVSILTSQSSENAAMRRVYVRLGKLDAETEAKIVAVFQEKYPLAYWEKGTEGF